MVAKDTVRDDFAIWESDNPIPFFDKLAENVSFIVRGRLNPLAGHYNSRSQVLEVFQRLSSGFTAPPTCKVTNIFVDGDGAVVEMSLDAMTKSGYNFYEDLCFVCKYAGNSIVEVRIYVDTAAEIKLMSEA